MKRISTATRISLTLTFLCLSLLFAAQTLGLIPDQTREILEGRKMFCKALAAQAVWAAQKEDLKSLKEETVRLMEKNDKVRSVTIRKANGQRLFQIGEKTSTEQGRGFMELCSMPAEPVCGAKQTLG